MGQITNKKRGFRYCKTCRAKLVKNGHSKPGKQLWKCRQCCSNRRRKRLDLARRYSFLAFLSWLLGKLAQSEIKIPPRSFRRQIAWCWQVPVPPVLTGEIQSVIILDGIRVGGQVCLIARTKNYVLAWLWADSETSSSWQQLMNLLPPPSYVICDGQKGILKALNLRWPRTIVQRCHFHIQANIRVKLTGNPQTKPAQDLARLMSYLRYVYTPRQRDKWLASFRKLSLNHADHLAEKTQAQNPKPGQRKWWYTHGRDRSAYRQISRLVDSDSLFGYVHDASNIPRTTNHLEGGTNSPIRRQLGLHRGLPKTHQKVLVNWLLYHQTETPKSSLFGL